MAFLDVLDEIDDMLDEAWTLPMTGGKCVLDGELIKEKLEKLRIEFPSEIKRAKSVLDERERILNKAKTDAQDTIKRAMEKRDSLLNSEEIVVDARDKAREILSKATEESTKMRKAAVDYVNSALKKTEGILENNLLTVKQARRAVIGEDTED